MKKTKTMREVMVALSLFSVAACGTVETAYQMPLPGEEEMDMEPQDDGGMEEGETEGSGSGSGSGEGSGSGSGEGSGSGSGEGSGSGSGSNEEPPPACVTAADCGGDGMACDVVTRECVMGTLTLDPAGFIVEGQRWWTNTASPQIKGTFSGPSNALVYVTIGSNAAAGATITGSQWSYQLPANAVTSAGTTIKLKLTDPSGSQVLLEQEIALDATPPVVAMAASKIKDERGDSISFSTAGPQHTHAGADVDLAAGGCPVVYKHAYLTAQAPLYGGETTLNPLRWNYSVSDVKVASASFRVRSQSGTVLRDWTTANVVGSAISVQLTRDGAAGIAALGTTPGDYSLDLRVRDWAGLETIYSSCWNYQPLAAPLSIAQATIPTGADALASWTLGANSPVSRLINAGGLGAQIAEQKIVQYSAEPVIVVVSSSVPTGTWSMQRVRGQLRESSTLAERSCSQVDCYSKPSSPTITPTSGALTSFQKSTQLVNMTTGTAVTLTNGRATLPGRPANAAPVEYRLRVVLSAVSHFAAATAADQVEHFEGLLAFTGIRPSVAINYCGNAANTPYGMMCLEMVRHLEVDGINLMTLSLASTTFQLHTAASDAATLTPPSHVPASTFVTPPLTWDGGDEDKLGNY